MAKKIKDDNEIRKILKLKNKVDLSYTDCLTNT